MIDGEGYKWTTQKETYTGMPTHDGTGTMKGNAGNGYARITYIGNDKQKDDTCHFKIVINREMI